MRWAVASLVVGLDACGDMGNRATLLRDPAQNQNAISFETGLVGGNVGDLVLSTSGVFLGGLYATGHASSIDDVPVPPPPSSVVSNPAAVEGEGFVVHTSTGCPTRVIVTGYPSGGIFEGVEIGWRPVDCRTLTIHLDFGKTCINPITIGAQITGWGGPIPLAGASQWPTGTPVQLDGGAAFISWSAPCPDPTNGTCSIVLNDDIELTATLDPTKILCDPGP